MKNTNCLCCGWCLCWHKTKTGHHQKKNNESKYLINTHIIVFVHSTRIRRKPRKTKKKEKNTDAMTDHVYIFIPFQCIWLLVNDMNSNWLFGEFHWICLLFLFITYFCILFLSCSLAGFYWSFSSVIHEMKIFFLVFCSVFFFTLSLSLVLFRFDFVMDWRWLSNHWTRVTSDHYITMRKYYDLLLFEPAHDI